MPSRTLLALRHAALLGLAAPPAAMAQDQAPQQQPAAPQSVQRIAAVVNDDIVSTQELRDRLALTLLFSNLPADPETQQRVAPQVLRRVIDEQLQLQEARRRNIRVPRQEVDGALANAAAANNMSVNQLFAFLTEQGIDPQALLVPATLAATLGFALPVASPMQAIVFGSGRISVREMVRAGIWLDLVGVLLLSVLFGWILGG